MIAALLACLLAAAASAEPSKKHLAGLGIHSEDYVILRKNGVVEQWTGKVWYHQLERDLYADWAEYRHEGEEWSLRGHAHLVWRQQDGTVLDAHGHEAHHQGDRQTGTLRPLAGGRLDFSRQSPEFPAPDHGEARRMEWDLNRGRVTLEGDVRTWGPSGLIWTDRADYDTQRRKLDLTGGRPVLVSGYKDWDGAVQANRVSAADNPRQVSADGKVRGWIVFHDRPAKLRGL